MSIGTVVLKDRLADPMVECFGAIKKDETKFFKETSQSFEKKQTEGNEKKRKEKGTEGQSE